MTKFAFLILNYKSTHETEQCVDSIENLEQEENDVQIIIVDNDSQDGCVEHFRKIYKGKQIKESKGIGTTNNGSR